MNHKFILLLIIFLTFGSFSYPQQTDDSKKAKFYNDLMTAEIPIVNQKKIIKLKDFEDKVIVVIFLASWCTPCVQQAKDLREIKTEFQKNNLFILGLNGDSEDKKDFQSFLKVTKFNYLMGFAKDNLVESLVSVSRKDAIPQTIIIHNGEIKEIYVGGGKTIEKVRKTLNEIFDKK